MHKRGGHLISSLISFLDLFLFHPNNLRLGHNINPAFWSSEHHITSSFSLLNFALVNFFTFSNYQPAP